MAGTNGQRLQEFLTRTAWDSGAMDRLRFQHMVAQASVGWGGQIIDDTGFAKKGTHSVGVARQYSGTLGRVDNCQVLVTSHYVDRCFDWPIAARLYLSEGWAQDEARLRRAKVPGDITFKTKGEIALKLIDAGHRCWSAYPGSAGRRRLWGSTLLLGGSGDPGASTCGGSRLHYPLSSGPGSGTGLW